MHHCATGFGALAAGLVRWELLTLPVELWFTSAPVCPAWLPVASLDHAGTWKRIWALPTSLWFGWLGFNGGSALAVTDGVAARAVATTFVASASSMLTWLALERILKGKSTSVGASVGAVAGRAPQVMLSC